MQQSKISVIIPIYNTKTYLGKCLDSVLRQTYKNIEVILVDDGSTDGSGELCEKYAAMDKRIRVYHKPQKSGVGGGRNTGLDHAEGEFLSFVDSDDTIAPDYLEIMMKAQQCTGADIVCVGLYKVWDKKKKTEEVKYPANIYDGCAESLLALGRGLLEEGAWAKIYRATVFEELRYPENQVHEDVLTTHKAFCHAQRVVQLPDCRYYYLQRSGSIMYGETTAKLHFEAYLKRYEDVCLLVSKQNIPDKVRIEFFKKTVSFCYNNSYLSLWRIQRHSAKRLKEYWKAHRKEICNLGVGFRCKVYFPYLSAILFHVLRVFKIVVLACKSRILRLL